MIWNLPQPHVSAQALAEYIAGEIRAAVGPGPDGGPGHVRELAEAVAAFIRDQHPGFARDTGLGSRTAGLPAEYLALLIGRALWSVGDEPAARRLLELQSGALNVPAAFLEAALAPDLSVLHWHVLLASRAVRSMPWMTTKCPTGTPAASSGLKSPGRSRMQ